MKAALLLILIAVVGIAQADDEQYLALKYDQVRMRNGPSFSSGVYYTYQRRFLPVKVVDADGSWILVTDWQNYQGWVNRSQLTDGYYLVVHVKDIVLYDKPDLNSRQLARLTEGVVVEPKNCDPSWCEVVVTQNDAFTGYVPRQSLWGRFPSSIN